MKPCRNFSKIKFRRNIGLATKGWIRKGVFCGSSFPSEFPCEKKTSDFKTDYSSRGSELFFSTSINLTAVEIGIENLLLLATHGF